MLHLYLSPDHITLCDAILRRIFEQISVGAGGQLLIVPEQYSFDMERKLASRGADTCLRAEVLSLSRLAGRVESLYGGTAQLWLDQGGRLLTADLAVDQAFPRLKFYASVCRKPQFLESLLSAVDEWESYNVEPADLLRASERFTGRFAQKLQELGLLYESYRTACGLAKDPILRLRHLCDVLAEEDYLADKDLYFFGFSDFTALEYEILETCVARARSVTLALPWEADGMEKLFAETDKLVNSLQAFCKKQEIPVSVTKPGTERNRPVGLAALQDSLSGAGDKTAPEDGSVFLAGYATPEDECRAAAAAIRLLLQNGARCREIGVACADLNAYAALLRDVFSTAEIPFYVSGKTSLANCSGASIVLFALRAVTGGMERESVLEYLKSGVLEDDRVADRLENYASFWKISGSRWFERWTMHPKGLGQTFEEQDERFLAALNEDREAAVQPLLTLKNAMRDAACVGDMVRAVHNFMQQVGLRDRLGKQADRFREGGELAYAQQYDQICDLLMDALEQMYLVDGAQVKKPEEFCALFERLLARFGVGTIPGTLDQVLIGDVSAFRGRSAKHLLILGASEGVFPHCGPEHGMFTETERSQLLKAGMTIAPLRADRIERELDGVCQTIRSAETSLRITYAGDAPSSLLVRLAEPFGGLRASERTEQPLNPAEAASRYLRYDCAEDAPTSLQEEIRKLLPHLRKTLGGLTEESVRGLYGDEIQLSPTKTDKLASCRFAFFLQYGLCAERQRCAELDPSIFGTFVHDVLEHTVRTVMERGGFRKLGIDAWQPIAEQAVDAYVRTALKDLGEDERTKYFLEHASREIMKVTSDLSSELRGSAFEPVAEELEFGPGKDVPPIVVKGEKASVALRGTVDRVDLYHGEERDYLRVVDYKTGSKVFDYSELDVGRGMQMLLYLFALKNSGEYGQNVVPAGVLYHPARFVLENLDEDPSDEKLTELQAEAHRRKGVVLDDPNVLAAMDDPDDPVYLPVRRDKKGNLTGDLADGKEMRALERFVYQKLGAFADEIFCGDLTPNPYNPEQRGACQYCDYAAVCQKDVLLHDPRALRKLKNREFFAELTGGEADHG